MDGARLLLLCERDGFAPMHEAVSAAGAWLATGGRCDLVLFHGALHRVLEGRLDEVEDACPGADSYRRALQEGRVRTVSAALAEAREAGLVLHACSASLALLGLEPDGALGVVDEVVGWPTVLSWMGGSTRVLSL